MLKIAPYLYNSAYLYNYILICINVKERWALRGNKLG